MNTYICYCLLMGSSDNRRMTRRLYELQDYYENFSSPDLPQQAFVYGDGEAVCLPFKSYPKGWRTGIDMWMSGCRTQDMLALSWRLLDYAMRHQRDAVFKLVILADEAVGTEESVKVVLDQLRKLKERDCDIIFTACSPKADCGNLRTIISREISSGDDVRGVLG